MTSAWTRWPGREALAHEGRSGARLWLGRIVRVLGLVLLVVAVLSEVHGWSGGVWRGTAGVAGIGFCAAAFWAYHRTTFEHRLWPSLGLLGLMFAGALGYAAVDLRVPGLVVFCACVLIAVERLPLAAALPAAGTALVAYTVFTAGSWTATAATTVGLGLAGYVSRLDAEARGSTIRLLAQERAARAAEAESAALAERARIAREIHDVLAHSLSAQLVHLEAARLLAERDGDGSERAQVLERIVAARRMAREGLAETRQALSALRGELVPVAEYLEELAREHGARLDTGGTARALGPEAGQAVRRVAQEALTNVRRHAAGAETRVRLVYEEGETVLEVHNDGVPEGAGRKGVQEGEAASGGGYGLLGMRERAELLGGTLEAGPEGGGFTVRLRVPE